MNSRDSLIIEVIAIDSTISGIVDGITIKVRYNRDRVS
jgi:hypothetical protein